MRRRQARRRKPAELDEFMQVVAAEFERLAGER